MTWAQLIAALQNIPADKQDNPAIINAGASVIGLETDEESGDYFLDTDETESEE